MKSMIILFILTAFNSNYLTSQIPPADRFCPEYMLFFQEGDSGLLKFRFHRNKKKGSNIEEGTYVLEEGDFFQGYLASTSHKYSLNRRKFFSNNELDDILNLFPIDPNFNNELDGKQGSTGVGNLGCFLQINFLLDLGQTKEEVQTAYLSLDKNDKDKLDYMVSLFNKFGVGSFYVYGRASAVYGTGGGATTYNMNLAALRAKAGLEFLEEFISGVNIEVTVTNNQIDITGPSPIRFSGFTQGITGSQSILIRYVDINLR